MPPPPPHPTEHWYDAYLDEVLAPGAAERRNPHRRRAVAQCAALVAREDDLCAGAAIARQYQRSWLDAHGGDVALLPEALRDRGLRDVPRWTLPPLRAVEVTWERVGVATLWASAHRYALALRIVGHDAAAALDSALFLLRGTAVEPTRRWYLHTRPSGEASGRRFIQRVATDQPVEDVRHDVSRHEGASLGDLVPPGVDPALADEFVGLPPGEDDDAVGQLSRVVASLLTCAHFPRTLRQPGGAARLMHLVGRAWRGETGAGLDGADRMLLMQVVWCLDLWLAVALALEGPLRRWARDHAPGLLGGPASDDSPPALAFDKLVAAALAWHADAFCPVLRRALATAPADALPRELAAFYDARTSLKGVARLRGGPTAEAEGTAFAALQPASIRLARALAGVSTPAEAPWA